MPWERPSIKDQKLLFVAECLRGESDDGAVRALRDHRARRGYVLKRRFLAEGPSGLEERSRAPLQHGRATAAELVVRLIEARKRWPHWGPKKLLAKLWREDPELAWPSASTGSEILRREGLMQPRRRRRRPCSEQPSSPVLAANDAWCIDFKGWFRTGDGRRCDPLTVSDAYSRYLLACSDRTGRPRRYRPRWIELFERARPAGGDPQRQRHTLRLDRRRRPDPPVGVMGQAGHLGWSGYEPGKPQQNGRHERMHGTLKPEACRPPAASAADQQSRFDAFRHEYNHERPHEALGQRPPAEFYRPSPRPFVEPVGDSTTARRAGQAHTIERRDQVERLAALRVRGDHRRNRRHQQRPDGHWLIRFADVAFGLIDRGRANLSAWGRGGPPRTQAGRTRLIGMPNTVRDVSGLNCKGSIGLLSFRRDSRPLRRRQTPTSPLAAQGRKELSRSPAPSLERTERRSPARDMQFCHGA